MDEKVKSFKPSKTRRSVPPYNPGLHNLVSEKQAWAQLLPQTSKQHGFRGWHQRGYLPHRDAPGLTQFVTFRLFDALPASRRSEWEALLEIEENRQRRLRLEAYLDRGHGRCWLKQPEIAAIAQDALLFFDGERYDMEAWIIMPNHIHVLVRVGDTPLAKLIQSWKRFVAQKANRLLRRDGAFWEREYWDTFIRDDSHFKKAIHYIEANPVKAGLVKAADQWEWSSARFRDETDVLRFPPR